MVQPVWLFGQQQKKRWNWHPDKTQGIGTIRCRKSLIQWDLLGLQGAAAEQQGGAQADSGSGNSQGEVAEEGGLIRVVLYMDSDEDLELELGQDDCWQLLDEDEDEDEDEELLLLSEEGDRDHDNQLSPVYRIEKRYGEAQLESVSSNTNTTPQKNLVRDQETILYAAACTGQAEGLYEQSLATDKIRNRFTVSCVSPVKVLSADHSKFVDKTHCLHAQTFRMTLEEGQKPWDIKGNPKADLTMAEADDEESLLIAPMVDPIFGTLYTLGLKMSYADVNTWAINPGRRRGKAERLNQDKLLIRFEKYMLPASVSYFDNKDITCAMVMFPDVDGFIKDLRVLKTSQDLDEKKKALKHFWCNNNGIVLNQLKESTIPNLDQKEWPAFVRKLKRDLARHVYEMLLSTWEDKTTGNCYVAVGRVLGYNITTIAHTASTLPGSSGALLIPTGAGSLPLHRNYIGIQAGYAPKCALFKIPGIAVSQPYHNLCTSCDNPDAVIQYWKHVISTICSPRDLVRDDETCGAFLHWIALHLRLIVESKLKIVDKDWNKIQIEWIKAAVVYYLDGHSESFNFTKKAMEKICRSPQILKQLEQIARMKFPVDSGMDLQRQFLENIKERIRVDLDEWNLPLSCDSLRTLVLLAVKLSTDFREEEQAYMGMRFHEFGDCRLSKYGMEVLDTPTRVLQHAVDAGFTSLMIPNRRSEETLKEALLYISRDKIQVLSRCGARQPEDVCAGLKESLERMDCGFIDVLLLEPTVDMQAMMAELKKAIASGLIRFVGLQSPTVEEIMTAHQVFPLSVVQVNLSSGIIPSEIIAKCKELGVGVISTSDIWEGCAKDGATTTQMNLFWKAKAGVVPFTVIQNDDEVSNLKLVNSRQLRFSLLSDC